ncbi:hypothetical protein D9613_004764 [Agrocybe pediades]|uniref:Fungal-type protein kinase domain-containing protein n=1 Tax=Agrocybe pediades TaxID=84607 RepID=A0A8H4VRK5_9AGAR|nr:hypothetical protein D9613_004764 [Agrocybe pediades]
MSEAMEGRWVGPMPVQQFMDSFLEFTNPPCDKPGASAKNWKEHFKSVGTFSDASEMCDRIRALVTESGALPGMKVLRAWEVPNGKGYCRSRTTLALFSEDDLIHATTPCSQRESMQLCILTKLAKQNPKEVKRSKRERHKEYCKISFGFEDGEKGCSRCRNEVVSHAKTLLNYQHRTHVFMVHMVDPYARLIRFDRDGAIVSANFNYREHGDVLLEFLWRYSNASEETRGRDPTVVRATVAEEALAKEKLTRWIAKDRRDRPVHKLVIQDSAATDQRKKMEVLVCAPVSRPSSVTGRATRGYVGYHPDSDEIVFVKDSWRSTDPSIVKETDTLRCINSAGITEGVPVLLCGDDLEGRWQSTHTADYSHEKWNLGRERGGHRRIHTRFATDKVGTPMEDFKSSKDFLKVVYDAFLAHKVVYNKCNILHCDVSVANILVAADGKGFLNDWDLARSLEDIESGPQRDFRTGTWRFMSSYLLARPAKFHMLQDDIESFFWVTVYTILCFLPNNLTSHLKIVVETVFDEAQSGIHSASLMGGTGKLCHITSFYPLGLPLEVQDNEPLTEFLEQCWTLMNSLYSFEGRVRRSIRFKTNARDMEREVYFSLKKEVNSIPLCSHAALEDLFVQALAADGWPVNDSAHDYLEEAAQKSAEKRKADAMEDYLEGLEEYSQDRERPRKAPTQKRSGQEAPRLEEHPTADHTEPGHFAPLSMSFSEPSSMETPVNYKRVKRR